MICQQLATRIFGVILWCLTVSPLMATQTTPGESAETRPGFAPGDTVLTVKEGVKIGVLGKSMISLAAGEVIRITEVRGEWIGGYAMIDGKKELGWVHLSEVRPGLPQPPAIPDVPDDTQAVEFWTKLGVKLQVDDRGRTQQLEVDAATIQDADLVHLAGLPHLISLDLTGQPITDAGLKQVLACRGLQKLYLGGTQLTDVGLPQLQSLVGLEVLALSDTKVSGAGIKHLQNMINLRVLNMGHCIIEDEDLRFLQKLSYLEVLAVPDTHISDEGLSHFRPLAKLRVLNLDHTRVSGTGFDNLVGLTQLRMLYVRGCNVDSAKIDKLDSEISGLAIYD